MIANLRQHTALFDESWKRLERQWQMSSEQWHDEVRQAFDQQYWQPLEQQVGLTKHELQKVVAAIERAMVSLR
jgi:hypothetical protein